MYCDTVWLCLQNEKTHSTKSFQATGVAIALHLLLNHVIFLVSFVFWSVQHPFFHLRWLDIILLSPILQGNNIMITNLFLLTWKKLVKSRKNFVFYRMLIWVRRDIDWGGYVKESMKSGVYLCIFIHWGW